MIKDIDISHYYKKFIETSNDDMAKYNKELELINKMKADCRSYIKSKNQVIKDDLKINLNEYGFQFLNDNVELINKLEQLINNQLSYTVGERRIVLLQLLRYCNLAKKANDYIIALKLATRRSELSLTDYKKYIHRYYSYSAIKFKYANYINRELRGKDAKQLNSECKTVDDIFNLKLGLRSKLLVYLEREPNAPFKYIRNVNQQKYERGAHNNGNKTRYKN
jgi:hypothetical protein